MTATQDFDRRLGDWLEEGAQAIPDWLVEQALEQAHDIPQVGAGIRWPWPTRPISRLRLAVVLLVLATLVTIAIGVGSNSRPDEPTRLMVPEAGGCSRSGSPTAFVLENPMAIPDSDVLVDLPDVHRLAWTAQAMPGVIGLGDGVPGLTYGYGTDGDEVWVAAGARGIVLAEVTRAASHGSRSGVRLGSTPGSFMAGLRDIAGYEVRSVETVRMAGLPAVAADVSSASASGWKHIDRRTSDGDLDCVVDFTLPSHISVVDVDGVLVLVQVWAADDGRLQAWRPIADALLESVRFTRG